MKVYLAGLDGRKWLENEFNEDCKYVLQSFYYIEDWIKPYLKEKDFLIDSGAFTFMNQKGKKLVNLDEYVDEYIAFLKEYKIKRYFELDVDSIKGIEWVEKTRKRIEQETGVKSIPVWHKSRGIEYLKKMCEEYEYIAIGGIVTKEIKREEYDKLFPKLLNYAHKKGCKVHGLGLTSMKAIKKYKFDSVDSTSWTSGGRFGQTHIFKNGTINIQRRKGRVKKYKELEVFNFSQWCNFQKYAERL